MTMTWKIEVKDADPLEAMRTLFKKMLQDGEIDALLVPQHLPMKNTVMPTLVTDPEKLGGSDPLAPVFPMNAAKVVSRLTRKPVDGRIAAVLRPCEIRAFIELVKLKQARAEEVILIGTDCLGAYRNVDYPRFAGEKGEEATLRFHENALSGKGTSFGDFDIAPACRACEHPVADGADLQIGFLGADGGDQLFLTAKTERGKALAENLGLPAAQEPSGRAEAVERLVAERIAYRDKMFEETREVTSDLGKLTTYFADCVNCYNCRVACPVCYCKECVFVTDVFDHEPSRYLSWARRKGVIKLPTDTIFYHVTRLAHMSTACVGCGQCSNACPNNIPVMEVFRTIAHKTQAAFDYEAGRSLEEKPPLSVFREKEYPEVTGGKDE
ncbi:MAG: Coenzyme F420 hydrogenase/dehydrogenase, beta subunit C-terminal domain [Deltaproteobacteria bacterium]|nr:Coenzyme F420 hydrogenase/dehydrogenase, beta subunit C-terminal domain [Deltaproteobacteria bacterium]